MPTFFVNSFGALSYGNSLTDFTPVRADRELVATLSNEGGKYDAGSVFDSLTYQLTGKVRCAVNPTQPTLQGIRDAWDAIVSAHRPGTRGQFKIDSDRYMNAKVKSWTSPDKWTGMSGRRPWAAELVSYEDPPIWDTAVVTQSLTTNGIVNSFTAGGGGPCDPTITIVVTAAPGGGLITITDGLGNICTLAPDAAGTFILNRYANSITRSGVDKWRYTTGDLLRFVDGANAITITLTGGVTCSIASADYQARYYSQ